MTRRWNMSLWVGFLLVLAGFFSYIPVFAQFPITRDFPWANLLLFFAGGILLILGVTQAFGHSDLYRGKIFGPILTLLSAVGISFFIYVVFVMAKQVPASAGAPHVGQKAPDFTLPDQNGKPVTLAELVSSPPVGAPGAKANGAVLIFYRGYW